MSRWHPTDLIASTPTAKVFGTPLLANLVSASEIRIGDAQGRMPPKPVGLTGLRTESALSSTGTGAVSFFSNLLGDNARKTREGD